MDRVPGCHVCAHLRPWPDHGWGGGAPDADGAIAGALLGLNLGEAIGEASLLSVADADPGRRIRPGPVTRRAFFGLEGAIRMARSTQVYGGRASLGIVRRAIERWEFAESGVLPAGAGRDGVAWPDGWLVTRHALHGPSAAEGAVEGFCPVSSTEPDHRAGPGTRGVPADRSDLPPGGPDVDVDPGSLRVRAGPAGVAGDCPDGAVPAAMAGLTLLRGDVAWAAVGIGAHASGGIEATLAGAALALIVDRLIDGASLDTATRRARLEIARSPDSDSVTATLARGPAVAASPAGATRTLDLIAWAIVAATGTDDVREAAARGAALAGPTCAAIAGLLTGARTGFDAVPAGWRRRVMALPELLALARAGADSRVTVRAGAAASDASVAGNDASASAGRNPIAGERHAAMFPAM